MVVRRPFTIIELLVAMTITVVCVNLLASLYIRSNFLAISQTGIQAATRNGIAGLDAIQQEVRNLIPPVANSWVAGEASDVRYPIYVGEIRRQGDTVSYPGIIFHRQKLSYETAQSAKLGVLEPGVEEVAMFLAPPEAGFSEDLFLSLYTVTNDNYIGNGTFNPTLFDGLNPNNPNDIPTTLYDTKSLLVERVIGMTIDARYYDPTLNSFTTLQDIPLNPGPRELLALASHNIESLQFSISMAPSTLRIKLKPSLEFGAYNDPGESSALEGTKPISDYDPEKGFYFQDQGYFANLYTGQVFHYIRTGDSSVTTTKVMDSACEDGGEGLAVGFSFQRYFKIR